MNDFEKAILLIRNPLNAIMSEFNDLRTAKINNTYALLYEFEKFNYSHEVFPRLYRKWQNRHDSVLRNYEHPLLVVEYEKLKSNSMSELTRILHFLGFEMTSEIEHCLLENSTGHFMRKVRPQKEIDEIYKTFTSLELDELQNTYEEYLKRFQAKLEDLQIKSMNKLTLKTTIEREHHSLWWPNRELIYKQNTFKNKCKT